MNKNAPETLNYYFITNIINGPKENVMKTQYKNNRKQISSDRNLDV